MRANTWWIGCILLLCGGLLLKVSLDMDASRQRGGLVDDNQPDFFMARAATRIYDEEGRVAYLLSAERWSHVRGELGISLAQPNLIAHRTESSQRWQAQAERGYWVESDGVLTLDQAVTFELWAQQRRLQQLLTPHMQIDYRRRTAHTDAPVRLLAEQGEMSGNGIDIDLVAGKAVLPSQVRGHYLPSQPGASK